MECLPALKNFITLNTVCRFRLLFSHLLSTGISLKPLKPSIGVNWGVQGEHPPPSIFFLSKNRFFLATELKRDKKLVVSSERLCGWCKDRKKKQEKRAFRGTETEFVIPMDGFGPPASLPGSPSRCYMFCQVCHRRPPHGVVAWSAWFVQ